MNHDLYSDPVNLCNAYMITDCQFSTICTLYLLYGTFTQYTGDPILTNTMIYSGQAGRRWLSPRICRADSIKIGYLAEGLS